MERTLIVSEATLGTAGLILLTIILVEVGGLAVLRMTRGRRPATRFQQAFARAGHGHAGVLLVLALLGQLLADAADMSGPLEFFARTGIWAAAILMSAGFFLASAGKEATEPNRLIVLVYAGATALALGVGSLGIGLLRA